MPSITVEEIAEAAYNADADGTYIEFKNREPDVRDKYLHTAAAILDLISGKKGTK